MPASASGNRMAVPSTHFAWSTDHTVLSTMAKRSATASQPSWGWNPVSCRGASSGRAKLRTAAGGVPGPGAVTVAITFLVSTVQLARGDDLGATLLLPILLIDGDSAEF